MACTSALLRPASLFVVEGPALRVYPLAPGRSRWRLGESGIVPLIETSAPHVCIDLRPDGAFIASVGLDVVFQGRLLREARLLDRACFLFVHRDEPQRDGLGWYTSDAAPWVEATQQPATCAHCRQTIEENPLHCGRCGAPYHSESGRQCLVLLGRCVGCGVHYEPGRVPWSPRFS